MSDTPNLPVDDLIREVSRLPGTRLRVELQGVLDQPLDPRDRQRVLRALDGLAERVDRLISVVESDHADWRSGRRDPAAGEHI
jgi:hypothetical protein